MMKKLILNLLILVLLAACTPQAQPTSDQTTTSLKVCYSAVSPTQAATWYAYEKGLFTKYGLEVELTYIASGSKSVAALITGDMDICQVAISGIVNAIAAGQDVVFVAGLVNTYPGSLYVRPEITSANDLKGRTLAVSQPGSANTVATSLVLRKLGLNPATDVTFLSIGSESDRYIALEAGQVDGALLFPPATLKAAEKGFTELYNLGETKLPYQFVGIGTSRALIEKDRPAVTAFVKAVAEALVLMRQDPEGIKAILAKYLELDASADAVDLEETYQAIILNGFVEKPYPSIEGIQIVIDSLVEENPEVANITPEQTLDLSILDELEQSGFFKSQP